MECACKRAPAKAFNLTLIVIITGRRNQEEGGICNGLITPQSVGVEMQAFLIISLHHSTHFYYFPSLFLLSALTEVQRCEGKQGDNWVHPSLPLSEPSPTSCSPSLSLTPLLQNMYSFLCMYLNTPFNLILFHSSATYQLFCSVSLQFVHLCDVGE